MTKNKRIMKQMFDVRPTRADGSLDLDKIKHIKKTVHIQKKTLGERGIRRREFSDIRNTDKRRGNKAYSKSVLDQTEYFNRIEKKEPLRARKPNVIQLGKSVSDELLSVSRVAIPHTYQDQKTERKSDRVAGFFTELPLEFSIKEKSASEADNFGKSTEYLFENTEYADPTDNLFKGLETKPNKKGSKRKNRKNPEQGKLQRINMRNLFRTPACFNGKFAYVSVFLVTILIFSLIIPGVSLIQRAFRVKSDVAVTGQQALVQFAEAKDNMTNGDLGKAAVNFEESYELLNSAHQDISEIGGKFSEVLRFVPGASRVATANYVMAAGENLALSGKYLANSAQSLSQIKNPLENKNVSDQPSLTELFINLRESVQNASKELDEAQSNLKKANLDDLPEDIRPKFIELNEKLPVVTSSLNGFLDYSQIFLDVLGYNGPRKFLFLFQNNQEMRATGGFIGSYGILDISNGRIKQLMVDDIYNPDGQLKARVIPPEPIQKMSAVWTMHDANWFPDFPTSAEKVSWFYEKTGGPTVDGVIAITPNLLQNLLKITGPIDMPEYETTVDAGNFIEKTQNEVEVDYDKELNKPKKFIADLTPKILDKVFSTRDLKQMIMVLSILNDSLKEKHLLLYSRNYNIQKLISDQGWSGEMLNTQKDYLSVINSNISGYKTDGVIDENIDHISEIQADGSIVDTVTVTRKHNGGNEDYDWWNKVNSDYMRIYVPEGSKLLEASGQTRETVSPPLDYQSLGFREDPQLKSEEDTLEIDEGTGTRIYKENHKTVFANWTYLSPGETMTLKYRYQLPFGLEFSDIHHPADSFSVLYQKQSGSQGSKLMSEIKLPQNYRLIWRYPDDTNYESGNLKTETILKSDKFIGLALERN
ncbi:MAG: DUF4012 domain-containing protein [Parcubacteria group bacterium]|jgi:hypothetical protein